MLPEDIQDLIIAFILLITFVIIGMGFLPPSSPVGKEDEFIYENLGLRDEEEVFFLNLLKTKIEDKTIADLIILNENEEQELEKEIRKIIINYGREDYEYGLRIRYSDEKFEDFGCTYEIEKIGLKQDLPSLNDGLIELYFAFRGVECFPI